MREVGGPVSFPEPCDAGQKEALFWKVFENCGTFVSEALGAGLLVFLSRKMDGSCRPVDSLGGEAGDVGLATAQMPQELVKGQFVGVLFSANDLLVLVGCDRLLGGIPNFWPLATRDDRCSDPAHIEGEVVESP